MNKYSNTSSVLTRAIESYLGRTEGNTEDQLKQVKINELIEFYENVLINKERINVVFNAITEDGTLICHGQHVKIEMPARQDDRNASYAARLNHVYEVLVTEVNSRDATVKVKMASRINSELRENVVKELIDNFRKAEAFVKKQYPDDIKEVEDDFFEKYSAHLDPEKDADEIERNKINATDRAVGMLIEGCVRNALEKQKNGKRLTENDRLFSSLIIPAKVYALGRSSRDKWGAIDLLGLHISGEVRRKYWADRFVDLEYIEAGVLKNIDKVIDVAIIGYSESRNTFMCSRRAVIASPWEKIEERLNVGDVIQIRCISKTERYFYGIMVGRSGAEGEDMWDEIQIQCYYPTSLNAVKHNVTVSLGKCYLCKIRAIDKDNKHIVANAFRESGKWESGE